MQLMSLEQLANFQLTEILNGSKGQNRELTKCCLIPASNDIQAIECWLSEYQGSKTTSRNYRKEAERLLLWSIIEKNKPISSLTANDLLCYSQFLDDPQPREKWCGPKLARQGKRWTLGWRPFAGALSVQSKTAAFKSLTSLFNYLTEAQYITHNPMMPVRRQLKKVFNQESEKQAEKLRINKRIIDLDEWLAIQDCLNQMPDETQEAKWEKVRLRFILAMGYFGALRNDELSTHSMSAFYKMRDWTTGKELWWLLVKGKGGKVREVPVNKSLLEALIEYRRFLNLPDEPLPDENEPLIKSLLTNKAVTSRRINQLIKTLTYQAALQFENTHPEKAARLKRFSEHWLRHLSCSMQALVNIDKQNIKENAGHESDTTTEIYLHAINILRHQEMEKLTWQPTFESIKNTKTYDQPVKS